MNNVEHNIFTEGRAILHSSALTFFGKMCILRDQVKVSQHCFSLNKSEKVCHTSEPVQPPKYIKYIYLFNLFLFFEDKDKI